jgi:hypothetical protein
VIFIIPRVAINGGSLSFAISVPFRKPQRVPAATAAIRPTTIGECSFVITTAHITEQKVMTVPMERSIPPVIMINVIPTASIPFTAVARSIVFMLLYVGKFGERMEKMIISNIRLANARTVCVAFELIANFFAMFYPSIALVSVVFRNVA